MNTPLKNAADFIREAVQGGYQWKDSDELKPFEVGHYVATWKFSGHIRIVSDEQIFTDPLAWQAVGKVRGWPDGERGILGDDGVIPLLIEWQGHQMDWLLAHNKTILGSKDAEDKFWQSLP